MQIFPFSMEGFDASDSDNEELTQSKLKRKIRKVMLNLFSFYGGADLGKESAYITL